MNIAENILPHNFDVCLRYDDLLVVTFSESTHTLNLLWIEPFSNSSFYIHNNTVILPRREDTEYTNPSIAINELAEIFITYFDTSYDHLYLLINPLTTPESIQISQDRADLHYSKITNMGNGEDMMIVYSHDKTLESTTYEKGGRVIGRRAITQSLSSPIGWSLVPNKVEPGPAVAYHRDDKWITFRMWNWETRQWAISHNLVKVGDPVAPLISLSKPGDFSIVWYEPNAGVFHNSMGYDVPWSERLEVIRAPNSISSEHFSSYLSEYGGHIGVTYTTSNGLAFVYTGKISSTSSGGGKTSTTAKVLGIVFTLTIVFVILKKIFLEWE